MIVESKDLVTEKTPRRGLLDNLALRYIGWLTDELPREFAVRQKGVEVDGRSTLTAVTMRMEEPALETDVVSRTDITITRSPGSPYGVAGFSLDRVLLDDSSIIYSVSEHHEQFVMGGRNNQLSFVDAMLSIRKAVAAVQHQ